MTPGTRDIAGPLLHGARWYTVWLTGMQLVVIAGAAVVNGIVNDPITMSVWQWPALIWIRYPLIAVGVMTLTVSLPIFLANGLTRRQFHAGSVAFGLSLITWLAGMSIVGFGLERLVYLVGGFDTELVDQRPLQLFIVYLVLLGCYLVTGYLMGGAIGRWSSRTAPWMITLFVLPMIAGELVLGTFWGGVENGQLRNPIPLTVGVPLMIAVIIVSAYVGFLVMRDMAIKPQKG
jgi:hypothetical protein